MHMFSCGLVITDSVSRFDVTWNAFDPDVLNIDGAIPVDAIEGQVPSARDKCSAHDKRQNSKIQNVQESFTLMANLSNIAKSKIKNRSHFVERDVPNQKHDPCGVERIDV